LHEPFQRRSTQRQRCATTVALACATVVTGPVAGVCGVAAPAELAKQIAAAMAIDPKIVRKMSLLVMRYSLPEGAGGTLAF